MNKLIDKEKLARLVELKATLDDTENKIAELFGGEPVKPKRIRRTIEQIEADEKAAAFPENGL